MIDIAHEFMDFVGLANNNVHLLSSLEWAWGGDNV